MPDYELRDPHKALGNELLRKSQKALYKAQLLETPDEIRRRLNGYSVAIWEVNDGLCWGVSTQKDSMYSKDERNVSTYFQNVLPAKGPGGMYLRIGDLSTSDKADSESLKAIVAKLEKIIGRKIKCSKSYDC